MTVMDLAALPFTDPFWGPMLAGAGSAGLAIVLGWLASLGSRAKAGWTRLRPGAMHWTGLVLSAGLGGLIHHVTRYVGSSRADGAAQMEIAGWLALLFAGGAAFSLWHMRRIVRAGISWREDRVRFRLPDGAITERAMAEIKEMGQSGSGWFVATFGDGAELRIDPYARGADLLLDRLADVAGKGTRRPPWR